MKTDILIVGSGCAGLYAALNLPIDKQITIITKDIVEHSDSFLAQGGMCMLKSEDDYSSYYEDTMKAGHYENNPDSVRIMIESSADIVNDLIGYGADFHREEDGSLSYTKEGAHSHHRIIFHEDVTGKEITSTLLERVKERKNITIYEHTSMVDILFKDNCCFGAVVRGSDGDIFKITANYTVLASGGIGGIYHHSTNFRHLTGDAVAIALKHGIKTEHVNYVQIHPTTLYSKQHEDRRFLISESVRGEGALLYNSKHERFVDELLPRDLLTKEIKKQMKKDGTDFVWEDMTVIDKKELAEHFPNIVKHCKEKGYDVYSECIPVVPAQHYFMGGIKVDLSSKTSMNQLYAIGETACNGVHGRNRLASNSLLESLVFAKRAAKEMTDEFDKTITNDDITFDVKGYEDKEGLEKEYKQILLDEIERENKAEGEI